jgi:glycosyltransferase involved in cell wall biosynthesis
VIDDGSTDGTANVLESFGDQITYVRQENHGAHAAINRGIMMSSGEFIAILDSDDAWLPNKLELQMKAFEENPEAGLVYSQAMKMDGDGYSYPEPFGTAFPDPNHAFEALLEDNYIPVLTALMRRVCIEDVGFFDESFKASSDWDMWIRIAAKWPIVFVPNVLAKYRFHENNTLLALTQNGGADRERLLILEKTAAAFPGSDLEAAHNRQLVNRAIRLTAVRTAYGLWYRHQYRGAIEYLLFAARRHPLLLKDGLLAVRLRFLVNLLVGDRGVRVFQRMKRLFI